ncbi:MAG TPA: AAA family ATPase [Terriglobia bacterium]|nr:AAA family ATPase [Terriglobia bacterium]
MQDATLSEILEWSVERPGWQRDALRRLFKGGVVTPADIDDLVDLCKAARGLSKPRKPQALAGEHLAITGTSAEPVSLASVTHHRGVNALAPEQTITFGPNLTVVYGQNAAGKSGYTRILKRACRSRLTEDVLGNVLSGDAPLKPSATISFREGAKEAQLEWTPDGAVSDVLAAVSVFDSHSAPVYLRDKTDVAFRPFGLDIFDKLSAICTDVRGCLEDESAKLTAVTSRLPTLPDATKAKALIDNLTSLTHVDEVRALATLSKDEQGRLNELRAQQRDLLAIDPQKHARELNLKADRMELVARHLGGIANVLSDSKLAELRTLADSLRAAREALAILRKTTLTVDLLAGTGEDLWRTMWEAAGSFSAIPYPYSAFPIITENARCPLCQQVIGPDAAARLKHLAEYASSSAQAEVRKAETGYRSTLTVVTGAVIERDNIALAISELAADDPRLAESLQHFLQEATRILAEVKDAAAQDAPLPTNGLGSSPEADLRAVAKALRGRAGQLQVQAAAPDPTVAAELRELESRTSLNEHRKAVEDEIERKKRLAAYKLCVDDTSTQPITRKSTELTKRLITDQLRKSFQDELSKLQFDHLAVEIQSAGGARGALYHRLVFTNAPGVAVTNVVSEGESRTLSLAAFLTELSTANTSSAIIFDDPVSSLDHIWRDRIAQRLVSEAKQRQVVVFTHDILFLQRIIDGCEREHVACHHQYVRRDGQVGVSSPDLPWIAMRAKQRIGVLRTRLQEAEKLSRTGGAETYEREAREIYGLLREAWEQAVSDVLLNDVVERYRPSIETQKVRDLHDITPEDCTAVEEAMAECSRWIRGHDQPPADATPVPQPGRLKTHIQDLDDWVQRIRKRRK